MIQFYNTLTRKKEEFVPLKKSLVRIYTCGPTVYNSAHIGNFRSYIFSDILKRTLLSHGYLVQHVINLTDVGHMTSDSDTGEDKMEKGARREGKDAWEIAKHYIQEFQKDIQKLHILPPDIWPRPTEHIQEQIRFVELLEKKGYTYTIGSDGVYFDTSKLKDYGKLARLDIEGLKKGSRVEFHEGKRNATDFALWKFSPKDAKRQMEWDSPWGVGFPGWHIECTAMSMKYLGESFDIHTGGIDHIPIHHTNEIAQAEAATGKQYVKYWMHNEFVRLGKGDKMAKSGENFILLRTLEEKGIDAEAYRFWILTAHYRSPIEFSYKALKSARSALNTLREFTINTKEQGIGCAGYETEFQNAMDDDLNSPQALAVLWNMIRNKELPDSSKKTSLLKFDKILGLGLEEIDKKRAEIPDEVRALVAKREKLRAEKKYQEADEIRKQIEKKGYALEDTPDVVHIRALYDTPIK